MLLLYLIQHSYFSIYSKLTVVDLLLYLYWWQSFVSARLSLQLSTPAQHSTLRYHQPPPSSYSSSARIASSTHPAARLAAEFGLARLGLGERPVESVIVE